jgi:hypothetical protein
VAAISQGTSPTNSPGLYRSTNDGLNWTRIAAATLPDDFNRPVIALAPSNLDRVYMLVVTASGAPNIFDVNMSTNTAVNRSASLPNFGGATGTLDTQGNYNLTLAVKPDNENFVVIGGTNLYRTFDGFATPINNRNNWINGYASGANAGFAQYANGHPDQHIAVFDPTDPKRMYIGNDGGIQRAANIEIVGSTFPWVSLNNRYNVTQFYHVSMPPGAGETGAFGGAQDNGSPLIANGTDLASLGDISSGDGAYTYWGSTFAYTSSQNGKVNKFNLNSNNLPSSFLGRISPSSADERQFIHPFDVDPTDDRTMYYPDGDSLWRNTRLDLASSVQSDARPQANWVKLNTSASLGREKVTAITVAPSMPNRVYYGLTGNFAPQVVRIDNANTATTFAGNWIRMPNSGSDSYLANIAVHPTNADEVISVVSNYNVPSLYRSTDAGLTWAEIEGNLAGSAALPGPSVRAVTMMPQGDGTTVYFAGTSTGLYATDAIDGANTVWTRQSPNRIGATVVSHVASRTSDGRVLVGTHGRGFFNGMPRDFVAIGDETLALQTTLTASPSPATNQTTIRYTLAGPSDVTLRLYDATGRVVRTLLSGERVGAGEQTAPVSLSDLAAGVYFTRLEAIGNGPAEVRTARLVVVR